jgi:hypothetical protein
VSGVLAYFAGGREQGLRRATEVVEQPCLRLIHGAARSARSATARPAGPPGAVRGFGFLPWWFDTTRSWW